MSVNFRDMSNNKTYQHQWIVLDGDIDAEVAVALPNGRAVAFEVHPATSLFVVKVRAG